MKRLGISLLGAILLGGPLISCATKKESPPAKPAPTPAAKPTPTPAPKASPTPAPTPEVRYTATVRVEGGETSAADVTPANPPPTPTPAPDTTSSPTPSPSPSPTPKARPTENILSRTWHRIFPPKPATTPAAGPDLAASRALTTPTPSPMAPRESVFARVWHWVFPRKKSPPAAQPPQWVGTVKLVNEREGYVLIDAANSPSVAAGQTLNSVGNDAESGVLRATADRNPPFFIADIVSGKPHPGDRIYSPQP